MRHAWIIVIIAALLIGACGAQTTAQTADQPTSPPANTTPAEAAPTEPAFLSPNSVPAPSPTPSGPAAIDVTQSAAEPTPRLILPAATGAAATDDMPATDDVPRMTLTPTPAPAADAAATPAPAANPAKPSQPVRLTIKDIGLDGQLVSVGLDKDRIPIVPKHEVGWYNLSARPGEGENIVLWGHVLRFRDSPKIPAPFAHLKDLKPGAAVVLYDKDGNAHQYAVTKQVWVTPEQVEYILPQGKEMVTMVSCIGDKIIEDGEVVDESHRLITIAEPMS
jgi:LPXTG-site transpeptidase (sortase) family protein